MAVTVAPLTTTVMSAVDPSHAGAASGVNNAVSRVAGLLAIAVFGLILTGTFGTRVAEGLDRLALSSAARTELDAELTKVAGADVARVSALQPSQRRQVRATIDEAFVASFRVVMMISAAIALAAAGFGAALKPARRRIRL
jgi:hypothetical protein